MQYADANAADSAAGYVETTDANAGAQPAAKSTVAVECQYAAGSAGTAGQRYARSANAAQYAGRNAQRQTEIRTGC